MKTIDLVNSKKECCGCSACVTVCPKNAISMKKDRNGFFYPNINENKCVNCQLCKKTCKYQKKEKNSSLKETYVAISGNTDILQSASGGIFSSYATEVLEAGGVVYGCALKEKAGQLYPCHIGVQSKDDLILLKGSKYVQSDMGNIYSEIKEQLIEKRIVLFSGTPCQVAGLRGFLKKDYDNLYTIDIICHGVPGIKFFQDYISHLEKVYGGKIKEFRFRDKTDGWKLHGNIIIAKENAKEEKVFFDPIESSYYQMFLKMFTYRENCYTCPYASDNRQGDVTIGDFWGIEKVHPELIKSNGGVIDTRLGVSCLIINNQQGKKLTDKFGTGIVRYASSYEKAAKYNDQLNNPSILKPEREIVFEKYQKGYEEVEKWYKQYIFPVKVKHVVIKCIPKPIKKVIKRMLYYRYKSKTVK